MEVDLSVLHSMLLFRFIHYSLCKSPRFLRALLKTGEGFRCSKVVCVFKIIKEEETSDS